MASDDPKMTRVHAKLASLRRRLRVLMARREHYKRRLRVLAAMRERLVVSRDDWLEASGRITVHLESVDRDLEQIEDAMAALAAYSEQS